MPIPMIGVPPGTSPPVWRGGGGGAQNVFVTRLHVRYDQKNFPEDLTFQETSDRTNFQARFILRHPYLGEGTCEAAANYKNSLRNRFETEATTLASLTGWNINEIRSHMKIPPGKGGDTNKWWKSLW